LNFRGGKFSKSRGAAVDVPYFLSKYDPDPLRYYLTATAPETRTRNSSGRISWSGTTTSWWRRGGTWGTGRGYSAWLSFAYKRFDGVVPEPGALDDEDRALLAKVEAGFETVGK